MPKIKINPQVVAYYKRAVSMLNDGGILVEPTRETIIEKRTEMIVVITHSPSATFETTKEHLLAAGFIVENRKTIPALN